MLAILKEIWEGYKKDLCLKVILFLFMGITILFSIFIGIILFYG